jgi:ABC-2 type transport system ATP-binding protein
MTAPAAVSCTGIARSFGQVRAVDGVSFEIERGEIFGMLGPNGAGKTTTIRMIATLIPPDEGAIEVFGHDVRRRSMAVRRLLGYLPQQLSVDAALTGYENVWLFARLFDLPRAERGDRIREALRMVGLEEAEERMASTYSGGMIRRLELAQALVSRPALLVLDEPTLGLDPVARGDLWERVLALRDREGMTVLLTTHYMEEADSLCDRVAVMHRGRIEALDTPAALKARLGPAADLEDVFRLYTGGTLEEQGGFRDARRTRRTASRLG